MQKPAPKEMLPRIPPHTGLMIPDIRGMIKNPAMTNAGPKRFNFFTISRYTINEIQPVEKVATAIIAPIEYLHKLSQESNC